MISSINNGQLAKKAFVVQSSKKLSKEILNILWDEGFILGYKESFNSLKIYLKYHKGFPAISLIKTLSKPSLRIYLSSNQLWKINFTSGLVILSTTKGLMSDNECKKNKLGGEPFIVIK